MDPEFFQQQFIGPLLNLEHDPVANVRMALARMLAAADLTNLPEAVEVLKRLAQDPDRYKPGQTLDDGSPVNFLRVYPP